ncbi:MULTISPECIES: hypothetical protein [Motiliproteus]|uniref:hypothetical protein n=1 Tax=Motiliproteus TaxID=1775292 RepID=UPI001403C0C8|nr:hypothetical protein [Motiliproteus coralliicola]
MIIECICNDGFEDQLTSSYEYTIVKMGSNSVLIENDQGQTRWYGTRRFEFKLA